MALESNRMLGFTGALLTVIGSISAFLNLALFFFPYSSFGGVGALGVLGLVGIILFMVAMKGFADDYKDHSIFDNALYGLISSIILGVVAGGLAVAVVFFNLSSIIATFTPGFAPSFTPEFLQSIIGYLIPVMPVVSVFSLVPAIFYMRAFNRLADKSGVRLFGTAGLLGVIGAVAAMILAFIAALLVYVASMSASGVLVVSVVGGVVACVAWILAAKAFYSIRVPTSQISPPLTPQTSTPAVGQVRYCPYCGAENRIDAAFCTRCGKKL